MKKNQVVGAIIVLVLLVSGGYAVFHKSHKSTTASNASSTSSSNSAVVIIKTSSSLGSYLADTNGNALYTDGSGITGVTNCSGQCLSAWPAYQDKGSTTGLPANVGTIKRSDNGETQYTYSGMPLYYFTSDSQGEVTGNGISGFEIAKPAATSSVQPTTTTPSSSSNDSSSSSNYPY